MSLAVPTSFDSYLFHEGTHCHSYEFLGAHPAEEKGKKGFHFGLWAPQARAVSVVGDFNSWNGSRHQMKKNESGLWSLFIPGLAEGDLYKYQITAPEGHTLMKADPYAFYSEVKPRSASRVYDLQGFAWSDEEWQNRKQRGSVYEKPLNIYEVHLGSWKLKEDGLFLTYRELAHELVDYVVKMGYTHIQLLPISEHPYDGSWGYQTTGYFAVTSRYGEPRDFMYFVNRCHEQGIGVILDWVPAHFCRDGHGLGSFDGTPLYESGEIPGWGTLQFDYGRPEVRSFIISNAVFWFEVFHIDGLRVDAVASMLYLDYGRERGQWTPNRFGGNGNLEAVDLLKKLNETVFRLFPQALMMAEESTEWPFVTGPTYAGGLGFNYKWNMGWMNDVLKYMETDPYFRCWKHNNLTFSFLYAFSENFILPMSHDEVVHGKRSLIEKMPGDYWQKFANLRVFLAYMMTHPGKKLLFMGGEIAQFIEWRYYEGLEWQLLDFEMHRKFQEYVRQLNHFYLQEPALWERDHSWEGFSWIDCHNQQQSIIIFERKGMAPEERVVVLCNFTPQYYEGFRIGVPQEGPYEEILNTDIEIYGGSGKKNGGVLQTESVPWHNQAQSLVVNISPLACMIFKGITGNNNRRCRRE